MEALYNKFDLQLFAEGGGDGGASAAGGESSTTGNDAVQTEKAYPKNIPERAKKYYDMAVQKKQNVDTAANNDVSKETTTEEESVANGAAKRSETPQNMDQKKSYKELIESDDYKADHEKHIQKVIRDRMKKHNQEAEKDLEIMHLIGQKYGLDVKAETFKADLSAAIKADDSVYEKYAEEHDVPIEEAKRMVGIEQQLARANQEAEAHRVANENANIINALRNKGEETKASYPEFDLDTQMKDGRFCRLVVAFNGDTTQAYEAINHKALKQRAVEEAEAKAQAAVTNSVRANLSRPSEGGLSSTNGTAQAPPDFRAMGLDGLRAWAAQHKKR